MLKVYDPEFVIAYDTETTGISQLQDEIVEISAKKYRRANRECVGVFYRRCRPTSGMIPAEATKVHGITYDQVKDQPAFFEGVHEEFYEFVRGNVISGHNIHQFDNGMTKIEPRYEFDTMVEFSKKFPRKMKNLQAVCNTLKIKFDADSAHGSEYDADRVIDIYWILTGEGDITIDALQTPDAVAAIAEPVAIPTQDEAVITADELAVMVQAEDVAQVEMAEYSRINLSIGEITAKIAAMSYSFSKLKTYLSCPYKWYKDYVEKCEFPDKVYFAVGHTCHSVAERSAIWCFREAFAHRFEIACREHRLTAITQTWYDSMADKVKAGFGSHSAVNLGRYLYDHPAETMIGLGLKLSQVMTQVTDLMTPEELNETTVTTPDEVSYEQIVNNAILENGVIDSKTVNDINWICRSFKKVHRFDTGNKAVILSERKVSFDKNWKTTDFFSKSSFWRGVVDYIEYHADHIVIRDYKSDRRMKTEAELKEDMQLLTYVVNVVKLIPNAANLPIRVEMVYMRYGKVIGFDIADYSMLESRVMAWIYGTVDIIQGEVKKPISDMFAARRNEFCGTCSYCENAMCPLFQKRIQSTISDPSTFVVNDEQTCVMAWKQIEANDAESKALKSKVRAFLSLCDNVKIDTQVTETEGRGKAKTTVIIDKVAELAIYCDEEIQYQVPDLTSWLMAQGRYRHIPAKDVLADILAQATLSAKAVDKLMAKMKIEPTDLPQNVWKAKFKNTVKCRIPGEDDDNDQD